MQRVRVFIDFWNFQAGWNERSTRDDKGRPNEQCDWVRLPVVLITQAGLLLQSMGLEGPYSLEETIVHASIDPANANEERLATWLNDFVNRQPSYRVKTRPRRSRQYAVHCQQCRQHIGTCPHCGTHFRRSVEKGVDSALVTDLLALGFENAFDVGILVSSDADFVPAVQFLQHRGTKIINAAWPDTGHELKKSSWADIDLTACKMNLVRE